MRCARDRIQSRMSQIATIERPQSSIPVGNNGGSFIIFHHAQIFKISRFFNLEFCMSLIHVRILCAIKRNFISHDLKNKDDASRPYEAHIACNIYLVLEQVIINSILKSNTVRHACVRAHVYLENKRTAVVPTTYSAEKGLCTM